MAAAAAGTGPASGVQQFARKRKRPSSGGAAAAATAQGGSCPDANPAAAQPKQQAGQQQQQQQAQQRQLTQLYLDVGQRHFHSYRCPTCGMLYARGTEADERLHAAFHASAAEGPRYQGWQGEKVAQVDGSRGRVLLFSSADMQGRGRKQLLELCTFLEEQMGLPQGWLLRTPLTLLLYVSAAKRIQAVVATEAIKEAYHVRPSLPPGVALSMLSAGSAAPAAPAASGGSGERQAARAGTAAPAAGAAAAAAQAGGLPVAAGARVATSGRSLLSVTLSSGGATAGTAECGSGSRDGAGEAGSPAAAAQGQQGKPQHPQQQAEQQAGQLQQQQQAHQQPQQQVQQRQPTPQAQHQTQQHQPAQQQQQQAESSQPPPPLVLDRGRRVRAVCGVRLMWVSLEARRRGLVTRLLDCCRAQVTPGYVVPRHELGFSAPTDDGRGFIEAYTGTRRFLVYE
ncbi:hypothetical protein ABPG75_008359 [Micractinium tetrahymenae]